MLPFLSSKNLVAIDIGTSNVKLVELDEIKGKYKLINFGIIKLPKETIVNGVIINADPLIQSIKNLISNLKINNKNVIVSVSGHPVIIKKITLPFITEEELEPNIETEAAQYIPFDLEEVNVDFQILSINEENSEEVDIMLVAAKKAMVTEYTDVLQSAGLKANIIDIDVFALENMFAINYDYEENEIIALIDIGASVTNINILKNSISVFNRDVSLGGNQITEAIQKELSVSFEEAEILKTGEIIEGINQELLNQIITNSISSLVREIQRTLDFFTGSNYSEIHNIYLSGGTSKLNGLKEAIEEKIKSHIEFTDPFKTIEYNKKTFDTEYIKDVSPFAAIGVGLASRKLGE